MEFPFIGTKVYLCENTGLKIFTVFRLHQWSMSKADGLINPLIPFFDNFPACFTRSVKTPPVAENYIFLYTSSNGIRILLPQTPPSSLIPQETTILISAPIGRFSILFTRRLSKPSMGQVS